MKTEFIPYEQALALKELGFDEPCFGTYGYNGENKSTYFPLEYICKMEEFQLTNYDIRNSNIGDDVSAPTFSQAFRFFREKYNTLVTLYSNASGYLFEWHDAIGGTHRGWSEYEGPNDGGVWDTYQEAEIAAIVKLIEIVKEKQ